MDSVVDVKFAFFVRYRVFFQSLPQDLPAEPSLLQQIVPGAFTLLLLIPGQFFLSPASCIKLFVLLKKATLNESHTFLNREVV